MAGISKAEQSQRTQRVLLDTARDIFTRKGYAEASTEEIVSRSKMTRGALYYHYYNKAGIFTAVFDEVRADLVRFIRRKMRTAQDDGADLWQQTIVGCHAFIERALTPSVQRIIHTDAPSVLDWNAMHQSGPGLVLLKESLGRLMDEGIIEKMPLDPLAHMLWGMFFEAGVYIAHADDIAASREETTDLLIRLVAGLRVRAPETDTQVGSDTTRS